ncbi:flagellar hook capping FlgD N-terminal domain-containing protein [Brachyspira murdochii]|uniref:Basal-body rod modification protein FlgD n=2 Tax=Brachyspira murdochii TaxID=84378 RepID=D5UA66_BRAM5|nr:flagellar hook capping FlgD N-terminal domain-containing protein [Brachyspira murdochii]ADG71589.1 flagellar hook capping protein [Brachyspira murdochii DSM 12563]PPS22486.1 flagellar hook capping protein [Brachyspira murdochii]
MISADALKMSEREIKILKQEVGAYNLQNNFQRDPTQNSLGKDAFLKLLTVQMSHQDPLSPMDNRDMIAQLAQFSSVEQMTEVNKNLDSMKTFYSSQTGYSMLGKSVEVMDEAGNRFLGPVEMVMENDTGVALAVRTESGLITVRPEDVMIVHSNGNLMASEAAAVSQVREAQSEDEAAKVFQSSLADKAQIITRPSDDENGNVNNEFGELKAANESQINTAVQSEVSKTDNANLNKTEKTAGMMKAEEALMNAKESGNKAIKK